MADRVKTRLIIAQFWERDPTTQKERERGGVQATTHYF